MQIEVQPKSTVYSSHFYQIWLEKDLKNIARKEPTIDKGLTLSIENSQELPTVFLSVLVNHEPIKPTSEQSPAQRQRYALRLNLGNPGINLGNPDINHSLSQAVKQRDDSNQCANLKLVPAQPQWRPEIDVNQTASLRLLWLLSNAGLEVCRPRCKP